MKICKQKKFQDFQNDFKIVLNYLHICSSWESSRVAALEAFEKIQNMFGLPYPKQCSKCNYKKICENRECAVFSDHKAQAKK